MSYARMSAADYRKAVRKPGHPERDLSRELMRWYQDVLPPGSRWAAYPAEQKGDAKTQVQRDRYGLERIRSGVVPGHQDHTLYLPQGRIVALELKAPRGTVSVVQQRWHESLRALGHQVHVVDSKASARRALRLAGVQLQEPPGLPEAEPHVYYERDKMPEDALPL